MNVNLLNNIEDNICDSNNYIDNNNNNSNDNLDDNNSDDNNSNNNNLNSNNLNENINEEIRLSRENMQYEMYQTFNRSKISYQISSIINAIFSMISLLFILLDNDILSINNYCINLYLNIISVYLFKTAFSSFIYFKILDHNRQRNQIFIISSLNKLFIFITYLIQIYVFYIVGLYINFCFYRSVLYNIYCIAIIIKEALSFFFPLFASIIPGFYRFLGYCLSSTGPYLRIGSDEDLVNSLPVYDYDGDIELGNYEIKENLIYVNNTKSNCIICFDDFCKKDEIKLLPCNHFYHNKCINDWLSISQTCPLCRRNVITNNYSIEDDIE